jgi:hypothetical protein
VGRVRVREQNFDVATRETSGDERTALWRELSAANRYLPRLQTKARRQLPLLLLTPTKAPGSNRAIEGGRGAARRSDSGHACSTPATAPLAETSPASSEPPTVISKEKT